MAATYALPPPPLLPNKHMDSLQSRPLPNPPPQPLPLSKSLSHAPSCPRCGTHVPGSSEAETAQRRVRELEAQIQMLTAKATAAVDKCADYEDQLRAMGGTTTGLARTKTSDTLAAPRLSTDSQEPRPGTANSASGKSVSQSRFSFLTGVARRGSPSNDTELLSQLEKERTLRAQAEERANKVDNEIEELSVQLFSQANEMVAAERKARAKLEARVEMLEKKDKDKMARLERLEKAVTRIDRVKAMLAAPGAGMR